MADRSASRILSNEKTSAGRFRLVYGSKCEPANLIVDERETSENRIKREQSNPTKEVSLLLSTAMFHNESKVQRPFPSVNPIV
jgi:hypothetical protein